MSYVLSMGVGGVLQWEETKMRQERENRRKIKERNGKVKIDNMNVVKRG